MSVAWDQYRVLVVAGPGGVGKTSVAATLGLAAAAAGRRTLVMTIDPARRLANALGMDDVGGDEREVSPELARAAGLPLAAPLWMMMPSVKRVFDELVRRFAGSEAQAQAIFANAMYQRFSTVLAGSLEYASVEKLYDVHASGRYDLIILDTPPTQNARDFLAAPGKMVEFLSNDVVRWFVKPYQVAGRASFRLLDMGTAFLFRTLGRVAGGGTLEALARLVLSFQGMYEGFRERSQGVHHLLRDPSTGFVLVTAAQARREVAVTSFARELTGLGITPRRLLINRVPPELPPMERLEAALQRDTRAWTEPTRQQLRQALHEEHRAGLEAALVVSRLCTALDYLAPVVLPELSSDVHDLSGLVALCRHFLDASSKTREESTEVS